MADGNNPRGKLEILGAPLIMFATVAVILVVALWLWSTGDERAEGAALSLIAMAATHLVKETQELLRSWLAPRNEA
jgi:hypothetical protein